MINVPIIIFPIIDCVIYHLGRDAFRLSVSTNQNQRSAPARSDKSIELCTATIQPPAQRNFVALTIAFVDFKIKFFLLTADVIIQMF